MTPEAQRIAIAEACGWKLSHCTFHGEVWHTPEGKCSSIYNYSAVPDYLNDLNAMHEAEKVLTNNQFHGVQYPKELFFVVSGRKWNGDVGYFLPQFASATASQRAEAFLRTLRLWKP